MSEIRIHGFGGFRPYGQEAFSAPVLRGEASKEAQIEHLMACLKAKEDELATLRMRLETVRLNSQVETNQYVNHIKALAAAQDTLKMIAMNNNRTVRIPRKKKSWKFWKQ